MLWLIESDGCTHAVVNARGRRKALLAFQVSGGGDLHHSSREPFLLGVPGAGPVRAFEAVTVGGEVRRRDEVVT